ncbi:hypothetical protein MICRO8M_110129 [Microbacterium sp. 8M]|nr:hypothetical protein MICRO8M_110129 [Microbacterium sp. 8M]
MRADSEIIGPAAAVLVRVRRYPAYAPAARGWMTRASG